MTTTPTQATSPADAGPDRPHLLYLAWGFPPAAKSCTYRMLATANSFVEAGWDVTVLTLTEDAWRREQGIDVSLRSLIDPRIRVIRVPLTRVDLETDIRLYTEDRAEHPAGWLKGYRKGDRDTFPELVFGRWHDELIATCRDLADETHFDLLLTSATPYTFFAPALDLFQRQGLPYVVDYRDAWAVDIIKDRSAFAPDSPEGEFEADLLEHATEAWFVNAPIRDAYRELYPDAADKFQIVRNGSDVALGTDRIPLREPDPAQGLTFGYLGTVTFDARRMGAILEGWRLARENNELLRRSTLEFRGHFGTGAARGVTTQAAMITAAEPHGVRYGGAVEKAATAGVYAGWDVLVLALVGGRFVTSGKVFDYISTGLPVLSIHDWDHAAVEILGDYPLWIRNDGVEAEDIAEAFEAAARTALEASQEDRLAARRYADRFERYAQIRPAVDRLTALIAPGTEPRPEVSGKTEPSDQTAVPARSSMPDLRGERVTLVYSLPPRPVAVDAITLLRSHGAEISLLGPALAEDNPVAAAVDRHVVVDRVLRGRSTVNGRPVRRFSPGWLRLVGGNVLRKRVLSKVIAKRGIPFGWWLSVQRDPEAMAELRDATMLTALDDGAVYTVWRAARLNVTAPAISGIGPLLDHTELAFRD